MVKLCTVEKRGSGDIEGNVVEGSVSVCSIERGADILIQVVIGDKQIVTVIAGIGDHQGIRRGKLPLKLHAEFQISGAFEGMRSGHIIWREEVYVLRRECRGNLVERCSLGKAVQHRIGRTGCHCLCAA